MRVASVTSVKGYGAEAVLSTHTCIAGSVHTGPSASLDQTFDFVERKMLRYQIRMNQLFASGDFSE